MKRTPAIFIAMLMIGKIIITTTVVLLLLIIIIIMLAVISVSIIIITSPLIAHSGHYRGDSILSTLP